MTVTRSRSRRYSSRREGFSVRIIAACALALVGAHLIAVPVRADQLKMECQVAQAVGAKEPVGAYAFLFDTASGSLSVTLRPRGDVRLMFGWDVKKWKLLFAQGGHAVFTASHRRTSRRCKYSALILKIRTCLAIGWVGTNSANRRLNTKPTVTA